VAFAPDGARIALGSQDQLVTIFPADGSTPIALKGHTAAVLDVGFSPDGKSVVSASADRTARVWRVVPDARDRRSSTAGPGPGDPVVLRGHTADVTLAAFSPDGAQVLTASADATARVWRADGTGVPVVLVGHRAPITHAAFSRDGARVVTASADGTARVWDATGRGEILSLPHVDGPVNWAEFSPDGTRVVTAAASGTHIWQVTLQPLLDRLQGLSTMCLEPPDRRRFLIEPPEDASAAYARCESQYGRTAAGASR
jgi:WD40 repeat protein